MKKFILLILIFNAKLAYSQTVREFNFIFMVNDELVIGGISNSRIITGGGNKIPVSYYPGSLIFEEDDYLKLISEEGDSTTIDFDYYEYIGDRQILSNFRLPFSKSWLNQSFTVMRVYNLDMEKYNGVFKPLDKNRNYTYELDYPGGQMLRERKYFKRK